MRQRKDEIKASALELFNTKGVDNVSTRDIARKLAISLGNLTYHFPTKNDIILALCRDLIENVDIALARLNKKPSASNTLVFFYLQCKLIGGIQLQYRFIFEKRYAEIITSLPEIQQYYQQVLEGRFNFYHQLHQMLVKEKLAVSSLVRESNAFGYLINLLGLFWHQETAIYFPHYTDDQKLKHSLSVVFQIYKPYLTKKGMKLLKPYLVKLDHYGLKSRLL